MKKNLLNQSVILLGVLSINPLAKADPQFMNGLLSANVDRRCADDSLSTPQAHARLDWAAKNNIVPIRYINQVKWEFIEQADGSFKRELSPLPYYPVFGTIQGSNVDTIVYWKPEANNFPVRVPAPNTWLASCRASCYTGDQLLLTNEGYLPIELATKELTPQIMTVEPKSTLDSLSYALDNVEKYTISLKDANQKIRTFITESGVSLKVTLNHPILDGKGVMKEASKFTTADAFVLENGEIDQIKSIVESDFHGKVFNVRPVNKDLQGNIIVAQGVLNGSSLYQNTWKKMLDRTILAENVPNEIF